MTELTVSTDSSSIHLPDVYFTSQYGIPTANAFNGSYALIHNADFSWLLPLVIKTGPNGFSDAQSPYGYSGIYAAPELSEPHVWELWEGTQQLLRQEKVVTLFLRHSPLVSQPQHLPGLLAVGGPHHTFSMRLTDHDTMWTAMAGRSRTAIRKALKSGLTFSLASAHTNSKDIDRLHQLYTERMRALGAHEHYLFSDHYFHDLARRLGDSLLLAQVRSPDGDMIAGAYIMTHGKLSHYHLSSSVSTWAKQGANNLMIWATALDLAAMGFEHFHLGGGVSDGDSLAKFKLSFGSVSHEYTRSGVIVSSNEFERLNSGPLPSGPLDFFPPYRTTIR